jgi:hypothetical protein
MRELKTLVFLCVGLLCGLYATTAEGSVDLALQIARVSANEGSFVYRSTTALVWQVVRENGGNTKTKRASFLARHSPRVNGTKACLRGNCFWSPFLSRSGAKPITLDLNDIYWSQKVQPVWLRTLADADRFVAENSTKEDPCPIKPRTWGGPLDREGALARGLYPIGCLGSDGCTRDSCNDGFTTYEGCMKEGVWRCETASTPLSLR